MSTDLEELRARIQAIAAKRPAPRETPPAEPRQPRPKAPAWSAQQGRHMVSTHDHWGFMRRAGDEQWCDREAGGCGQEWVFLGDDGGRPPKLYARPYQGSHEARPYGASSRGGG